MAEDDDDDEGFGNFKFATYHTYNVAASSNKINGGNSSVVNDDDDWGDFIDHSPQISKGFQPSNGFSFSQSPRNPSETSNLSDPFGFQLAGVELGKEKWVKPQGALPLSIFGEEEEKEESVKSESITYTGDNSMGWKISSPPEKGLDLNVDVGIATLYSQNQKIEVEKTSIWESNGNASNLNINLNDVKSESSLNTSSDSWISNINDMNGANLNVNELTSNSELSSLNYGTNGVGFNHNNISSNLVEASRDFDDEDDDDYGWEFKAADLEATNGNENSEVNGSSQKKIEGVEYAFGFGTAFIPANGISEKLDVWDLQFDLNSSAVPLDGNLSYSHFKTEQNGPQIVLNQAPVDGKVDTDDSIWDFRDGFYEARATISFDEPNVSYIPPSGEEVSKLNGSQHHILNDSYVASTMFSHQSGEWDFGLNFNPGSVGNETTISDAHMENKLNDKEKEPNISLANGNVDSDDNFAEFNEAFSDHGLTQKINEELFANNKEDLPNFNDRKLENDNILISQDVSTFKNISFGSNSPNLISATSIHDLITSLYNKSEQKSSVDQVKIQNGEHINSTIVQSRLESDDDDFDDESWEFKDASPGIDVQDRVAVMNFGNLPTQISSKAELKDFVILYCKLKNYLSFLAFDVLENLKKAQSNAAPASEDTKTEVLDEEIQKLTSDLTQGKTISDDVQSKSLSPCLDELLDLLQEPKFQFLESEYQLSNKLSMVEKDITSIIELLRHTSSTLRILDSESAEKQSVYVCTWSKMLSVCAQELRHGALIWKESLQNNIQTQVLSEPRGRNYILALGEIYRVVKIIRASVKLYKPWILLGYVDSTTFFSLLSECYTLWSSSGLDEALLSISVSIDLECKSLVDSVKYIHDVDEITLHNHLLSGKQPKCHLSALTVETIPGTEMVEWNGEHYFLKLANLWANLITRDPPFSGTET